MTAQVTLILGNGEIAEQVAIQSIAKGDTVILVSSNPQSQFEGHAPVKEDNYQSYVDVFQSTITKHGGIDTLILAFTPSALSSHSDIAVAPDEVLQPLLKSVKLAWYHYRRDARPKHILARRKLVILGTKGHDVATSTIHNAVLGFYRSITPRTEILGVRSELVIADLEDQDDLEFTVNALLASPAAESTVHLVENGKITSQSSDVGQCHSLSIQALGARLGPLIWLGEKVDSISIRAKRLLRPPKTASALTKVNAAILRYIPAVTFGLLAVSAYDAQRPFYAFVLSLVVARTSTVGGTALLAFMGWTALLG